MTEAEWLAGEDLERLLRWLEWGMRPERKWQLFALACLEPLAPHIHDERLKLALSAIARNAEGRGAAAELESAREDAEAAHDLIWADPSEQRWFYVSEYAARAVTLATQAGYEGHARQIAKFCSETLRLCADYHTADAVRREANDRQVSLIYDIFGNPFRPVALDPLWLTFDVQALAQGIDADRAFDRMPILADALQDAGCDNPDVLNHCRDPHATHVRGCWVLDLLLGKG